MRLALTVSFATALAVGTSSPLRAQQAPAPLIVASSAFVNGAEIPKAHTWANAKSPQLSWTGAPDGTARFAVIAADLDMINPRDPGTPLVLWVVYGIPGTATGLPTGMARGPVASGPLAGTIQGFGTLDRRGESGGGLERSTTTAEYPRQGLRFDTVGLRGFDSLPTRRARSTPIMKPVAPYLPPRYRGPFRLFGPDVPNSLNGPHRIVFTVYATDAVPALPDGLDNGQLMSAIDGHIVAQGELTGTFSR